MTHTEILALPAGPELDALVAEKVMGWQTGYSDPAFRGGRIHYRDTDHNTLYLPEQWTPSESIVDAWEVIEKLRRDRSCNVSVHADGRGKAKCRCYIDGIGGMLASVTDAETAPLAICRAALLAVEGKPA